MCEISKATMPRNTIEKRESKHASYCYPFLSIWIFAQRRQEYSDN